MSVGTTIDSTIGPNTTNNSSGLSVARDVNNQGFSPYKQSGTSLAITGTYTLLPSDVGVTTVSGNNSITLTAPLAANCAGASFIIRSLSNQAHIITGSQEVASTRVFKLMGFDGYGISGSAGSRITLKAGVGESVGFTSDGVNFLIFCATSASCAGS